MSGHGSGDDATAISWQSVIVAGLIIALLGAIAVTAIIRYGTPEEALKIWASLSSIAGLLTGAFVTYFFTRGEVNTAKEQAKSERQRASDERQRAAFHQQRTEQSLQALAATAGHLDPHTWQELEQEPSIQRAVHENTAPGG